jgi:hypothetical protein
MELKETSEGLLLKISRQELRHYLDVTTEAFINGKLKIIFPVENCEITEVMVYDEQV